MRYFKCDDLKPKDREIITQDIRLTEEEKKRDRQGKPVSVNAAVGATAPRNGTGNAEQALGREIQFPLHRSLMAAPLHLIPREVGTDEAYFAKIFHKHHWSVS